MGIFLNQFMVRQQQEKQQTVFARRAAEVASAFHISLGPDIETLDSVGRYITVKQGEHSGDNSFDPYEFLELVNRPLARGAGLRALGWLPRVEGENRDGFEERMAETDEGFELLEFNPAGQRIRAEFRPLYFPVAYVQPVDYARPLVGADLFAHPLVKPAMIRARDSGGIQASLPVELITDAGGGAGVFLI
ncbi:MAG: CHASE domain-containing protein, partial [Verrucomicrobiota bacterium]